MAEAKVLCWCKLHPDAFDLKNLEDKFRKEIPSVTSLRSKRQFNRYSRAYSHTTFVMSASEFFSKIRGRDYFVIYMQICERKPEPVRIYRHRRQ